ncbi:MAG: HAMP domain-containing sensor histidine kinase, partial [Bacteroidota bacterium]
QAREQAMRLEQLVPEVALAVNRMDHELLHNPESDLEQLSIPAIASVVDSVLRAEGEAVGTYFALFQRDSQGVFLSNGRAYQQELLETSAVACISCIHSITFLPSVEEKNDESSEDLLDRLLENDPIRQFYTPISQLEVRPEETLWLAIYQPIHWWDAIGRLGLLLFFGIVLLGILLALCYYLLQSLARHKQLSTSKEDFFNNLTHEFKTPLSSILLASRVLQKTESTPQQSEYHRLIERETRHLVGQVDRMLDLSIWDRHEGKLEVSVIHLDEVIQSVLQRLGLKIAQKAAQVELDLGEQPFLMRADAEQLGICLANLLENSLKYSPPGVQIQIQTKREEHRIWLRVSDNGPGIPKDQHPFIFDRFYRGTKNASSARKGFGIGLSYVHTILQAHGASIRLEPSAVGTSFIIEFPL